MPCFNTKLTDKGYVYEIGHIGHLCGSCKRGKNIKDPKCFECRKLKCNFEKRIDNEDAETISKKLGMTAEQTHDYFAMLEAH